MYLAVAADTGFSGCLGAASTTGAAFAAGASAGGVALTSAFCSAGFSTGASTFGATFPSSVALTCFFGRSLAPSFFGDGEPLRDDDEEEEPEELDEEDDGDAERSLRLPIVSNFLATRQRQHRSEPQCPGQQ
mmetsp:Transcript_38473/g.90831  ORF Transcript_38473/g.90831 Transcript_38473/m.90831 type:complete len:132 (-) Transcript_38473:109-504(-)